MRLTGRSSLTLLLLGAYATQPNAAMAFMAPPSSGVIINETFDEYADQAAFEAVWTPTPGVQDPPFPTPEFGVLIPTPENLITAPNDQPPDLQGRAVYIENQLNVYAGPAKQELASLMPTLEAPIRLSADLFDDGKTRSKRLSVGIRNSASPANIIELGHWNGPSFDPTDPSPTPPMDRLPTGFAYRIIQFGPPRGELQHQPNYQYFPLDAALEDPSDADALVTPTDVGPGWHRYSATIGVNFVKLTLDLFRDGINNATGMPGLDSEVTWDIAYGLPVPLDSLRIGGPSGLRGVHGGVVDNITLERVGPVPEPSTLMMAMALASFGVSLRRSLTATT